MIQKPEKRPWSKEELFEYLDYLQEYGEFSFYYLLVLTEEKQIGFNELVNKIKVLSGKKFTGKNIAGVLGGMSRRSLRKEKLVFRRDDGWIFLLNPKYSEIFESYFSDYNKSK